ncbi:hypothetical protein OS493_027008 [Desmophyllum pertusum]|uniref:Uncharacterized protein n=1 Tax=Desmophyllum pertusum TaxID=174260 RepID=A0A9W9YKV4_9CNID|nr:hypothetical protein OS493_027008 [Desmophyllum pertusum]
MADRSVERSFDIQEVVRKVVAVCSTNNEQSSSSHQHNSRRIELSISDASCPTTIQPCICRASTHPHLHFTTYLDSVDYLLGFLAAKIIVWALIADRDEEGGKRRRSEHLLSAFMMYRPPRRSSGPCGPITRTKSRFL